jgi:hypothetical protein
MTIVQKLLRLTFVSNLHRQLVCATVLLCALCVLPSANYAQKDEVGPTKPVIVVNPPSQPVPVTGTISGSVNIANTPTVNAKQSGLWDVGIVGTPTVKLDPGSNTVQFAPRSTTVLFDSNRQSFPADFDRRQQFGPINIAAYSKVRVLVAQFGGTGLSGTPIQVFVSTKVLSGTLTLDVFDVTGTTSKVYEVAGTELTITLGLSSGNYLTQVVVFGN